MAGYRITVRAEGKVARERADDLEGALATLERRGRELQSGAPERPRGGRLIRRFEPVQQVAGRIELSGPAKLRAGIDVRGDGSAEAFTGRVRRTLVRQRDGESPYDALRRELAA